MQYSLTTPQQNIWNLQKFYENTSISNLCGAIFYNERLDPDILAQAINKEIELQAGLRLRFREENGAAVQYIADYTPVEIPVLSFASREEFEQYAESYARQPIGLIETQMHRFSVFEVDGISGVIVASSHLVSDAWTFSLYAKEVSAYYNAMANGEDITDTERTYADYIEAEQKYFTSDRYAKDKVYWEEKYSAKPENCPIRFMAIPVSVPTADRYSKIISAKQTAAINEFCDNSGVSQAVLFEAAMMLYLSRINEENSTVTLGVPVLNRTNVKEKSIAGMFISTTPLTVAVSREDAAASLCQNITDAHKSLFRHQKYPYSHILQSIREKQDFTGNLYDVMVSFQNAKTDTGATTKWYTNGYSEVPLALHIDNRDSADSYTMTIDYQTEVFRSCDEVAMLAERILHIIGQMIADSEKAIKDFSIIPEAEYDLVINKFNDTAIDYPREKCVHELFSEQASRTPDKIALVFEDKQFTYKQLDEMSNSLAHYLREKGVKPNDVVPIIAKRSWHIIVAMLGILKAGGAYMPVDISYPTDRITYMLEESKANIALMYGYDNLLDISAIDLAEFDFTSNTSHIANVNTINDLCYVLFTSGSTGKPKAAMVAHYNLNNFTNNNNNNNPYQCNMVGRCNTVLAVTTFVFDISVFEIYLSFVNGLKVILTNDEENISAEKLAKLITKYDIDVIHSTPTKLLTFLENADFQRAARRIKMLMVGAEVFTQEIYNTISKYTNATIYNGYGPTETTIGVSFKRINNKIPCVHELFSEQVAKTPDKIALVFEDKQFTYKQLDEMSNSLAHYLREKGVKPNDVVPIIAKRSWHIIVAMLGILKAGGAYMPIDPAYPLDRIESMIADAGAELATVYAYENALSISGVDLDSFDFCYNTKGILNRNEYDDSFCILHTSGTTGKPKCAALTHRNMCNFIESNAFLAKDIEQTIAINTITFDVFEMDSIFTLCMGLMVVLTNDDQRFIQSEFEKLVYRYNNSLLWATPTNITRFLDNSVNGDFFKRISVYIVGGEVVKPELINRIKNANNDVEIYTVYGPTETLIYSTMKHLERKVDITLGNPIANTQIYILDQNRKPVPIGVASELCISGDGVGKSYLNRPELTAEKFIPNPFIEGKTMYCTGDLARWREDGEIEYLGRIDTQVKIRGLRIELGEIESVMSGFEGIHMTAVTDKRDENNRQYLVGYYTADTDIDEKALRQHLAAKLPKYMVPNYFVRLDEMPMTATGKTDRKALPMPDFTVKTDDYVAPVTETEKTLAELWSKLLKLENVSRTDDFFDLGGDSLMAITLLSEIENIFGADISMKDIVENPVLDSLAMLVDKADRKASEIKAISSDKYVLLPQQKAIYAVCSKDPDTLTYNMPTRIPLPNDIDREKIKTCFEKIVQQHRSLRTYISAFENEIFGIYDESAEIVFEEYSDKDYSAFIRPFDLAKAPLIRIAFTETAMLFDMHHIIGDGEALNIILRDLAILYNDGETMSSDIQYSDYSEHFYNADLSAHKEYFRNMLKCDFEPIVLPEKKHITQSGGVSKIYSIDKNTFEAAKDHAHNNGLTDTMVFLGAFGILLSKFTAKSDILSSIVLTNRTHKETQDIVGMFVNTLPVYMPVKGTTKEYLAAVKDLVLNLFEYQELPFFEIAEAVKMVDKNAVNTSFVYQADGVKTLSVGSKSFAPEFIDTHTAKFDLSFELTPTADGCNVRIEYNCGKYEETLIDRLFKGYMMILKQLKTGNVADISVLDADEYNKIIYDFNDTAVDYSSSKCVHHLFMEQVAKTPDKTALVFEDKQFTYKQLDEMSNSLAHYLRDKGIKNGDVIGVLLDRSEKVIISQLASLKLGCAFLPIDSRYPAERVQNLLNDCKVGVLLTDINSKAEKYTVRKINVADGLSSSTERVVSACEFEDVCYIIYTSGSTGKPKGCSLTYRGITNFCKNNNLIPFFEKLNKQNIVSVNTISFDYFIAETLLPLSNGYTVVLANEKQSDFKQEFKLLVVSNDVNIIMTTPTRLKIYTDDEDNSSYFNNMDIIVSSGEVLSPELLAHLKSISNAKVFNPLGPSECSVWNVDGKFNDNIFAFNYIKDTAINLAYYQTVHELFEHQAAKTPDKIALVFEDKQFPYKQLDEMSNSLAHYLREKGVKPNDVVPIIAKRSWHIIVAMLGILKAGGAYMPVDPEYPADRIEYMFETANVSIATTYGYNKLLAVTTIDLATFDYTENTDPISNINSPDDLCYIIFTSGSTGKPKGVAICHRNVVNYCHNNNSNVCCKIIQNSYDSIVSVTNIIFDIFVTESILPLLNGITIYFANDDEVFSQERLSTLVKSNNIDVMQTTPTKMRSYILDKKNTAYLSVLRVIVLGGEAMPTDLYLELKQYTDAEIFNIYGPAETTVWSTNKRVDDIDITIGKPIANTQIYILDPNRKPLPIGVAGELCISGDGVGKGYLNRPELTAEKFIPNPFIEGKTMYCTGDLARWREDGEIEYLGRIDTQVKIRGLRIELGEIESVMSGFEGIHMTAVTDKRDENNRQYLVGYYTADTDIDEKALRQHLAAKLPKYMVPNYFVHLEEMPMTASGKTDRKNLPLPDFTLSQEEYVAPETVLEKQLCGVLCELFSVEQIGVTDDFFDIGGDSLKAIEYVAKAHTAGVEFALQNVFDYPSVRELCNFLENGVEKIVRYTAADFEKYEEILSRNVIDESFVPEKRSLGNVLLTGATGFLGAHILDNLMQNETGKIYCLVRSNSADDRRGRWPQLLNYYFGDKYDNELGKRIIPIVGDITNIILSPDAPEDVQTVIHTAATVKHYGSYDYFRSVNVEGTRNVVSYAKRVGAKMIHISTLSVSGNSLADEFEVYRSAEEKNFYESSLFIDQPLENVYVRSKFEAELEVLDAMRFGLDAKIVRVGNLTNRLSDSKFQPNYESNAFLTRFKAAVELGMFPDYLLPLYAEFSPIDQTAEGVVKIAQYADKQCVFHLNSNRPIYFDRLLEVFRQLDVKMELVSGEVFNATLQRIAQDSQTEYIYEAFQNDMDESGKLIYDSNIRLKNDFTDWFMRKLGFEWAQIDYDYIKAYVEYFREIGYLEI